MLFRSPLGVIIWVISATVGITFAVVRYQVLDAFLPTEALAAMETARNAIGVAGEEPEQGAKRVSVGTAKDGPDQYLIDGPDGFKIEGPIAAMTGNRPALIKDVIDGYSTQVGSTSPAELMTIRPISGCRLTPPLEGTAVGHVTAGTTGLELPILTYNDTDLAAAVQSFVNLYRESGKTDVAPPAELSYEVYDVAVTEMRAPVYLVLESSVRNRVWNIHLAPGARIERVILLGGVHSGVANLDPVVPVEVLPAAALAACGIQPAYALNPGHRFFQELANGPAPLKAEAEAKFSDMQDSIAAYNTWFRDSFGVRAEETRAGFGGTISVIGPLPGDGVSKATYSSIQGSRVRMTQDDYVEVQGQAAAGEDFSARVKAIATSFAFGDLATLRQGVQF
jgi:hypothetical protein